MFTGHLASVSRQWPNWQWPGSFAARVMTHGARPRAGSSPCSVRPAPRPHHRHHGKAVLDLLTAHQVIEDDAKVMSVTSRWDETVTPGRVQIAVVGA